MALKRILIFLMPAIVVYAQPACTSCPPNGLCKCDHFQKSIKGIWSQWADTSQCTATCGLWGTKNQARSCTSAPLGCPCDAEPTTRTTACPVSPLCLGTVSQQCMPPYSKWANKVTKRNECGNVTASTDYVTPSCVMPGPACGFCTSSTPILPIVTDGSIGDSPFASDVLTTDSNGCSLRTFTCTSTAPGEPPPWPATIEANNDLTLCDSSGISDTCSSSLICNSDGTMWTYTASGATLNIERIGCSAVTCETYPSLC